MRHLLFFFQYISYIVQRRFFYVSVEPRIFLDDENITSLRRQPHNGPTEGKQIKQRLPAISVPEERLELTKFACRICGELQLHFRHGCVSPD